MKDKGFTLIELLAVIVILAIIALIATPIILGIINDAKKQSNQRSAELYLKAAELAIARYNLTNELGDTTCSVVSSTGNLSCTGVTGEIEVEMDGEKPTSGTIVFSNGKITSVTNLQTSGKTFETNSSGKLVIAGSSSSNTDNNQQEQGGNTENTGNNQSGQGTEQGNTSEEYVQVFKPQYYTLDLSGTVNTTAAPAQPSTTPPTGKNVYIGYNISNGVVSEAYACFVRNSNEYCLKGYDTSAYSTNQDVLRDAFEDVAETSACSFGGAVSACDVGGLDVHAHSDSDVDAKYDDVSCNVNGDSSFYCK